MTSSLVLAPEAKTDIEEAFHWYEEQNPGLGMDFLRCVEAALLILQRSPRIHPVVHEVYRRSLIRRFPFAIFFEFDDSADQCTVYAVFHCSQDPSKWHSRLPS